VTASPQPRAIRGASGHWAVGPAPEGVTAVAPTLPWGDPSAAVRWEPGTSGRPYLHGGRWRLPEWVVFVREEVFRPDGFASGHLLDGVVSVWAQDRAYAGVAPETASAYWSSHALLYVTLRRYVFADLDPVAPRCDGYTHSALGRLAGIAPAGRCGTPGPCRCQPTAEPELGPAVAVHAQVLLGVCSELFPPRPRGWLQLHHALRPLVGGIAHQSRCGDSGWEEVSPELQGAFAAVRDGVAHAHEVTPRLCDALQRRYRLDDETCEVAAALLSPGQWDSALVLRRVAAAADAMV
jgi:hypothetical protein